MFKVVTFININTASKVTFIKYLTDLRRNINEEETLATFIPKEYLLKGFTLDRVMDIKDFFDYYHKFKKEYKIRKRLKFRVEWFSIDVDVSDYTDRYWMTATVVINNHIINTINVWINGQVIGYINTSFPSESYDETSLEYIYKKTDENLNNTDFDLHNTPGI